MAVILLCRHGVFLRIAHNRVTEGKSMVASQKYYTHNPEKWHERFTKIPILPEPCVKVEKNAVILPLRRRNDVTSLQGGYEGGVCTAHYAFITGHQRDKTGKILNYSCLRAYRPQACAYREETVIYGGVLFGHFGHFILDALARLWYFAEHPDTTYKFVFLKIPTDTIKFTKFLELAGLTSDRYEILEQPTQFAAVIIPDQAFVTYYAGHPRWLRFFDRIRDALALPDTPTCEKVYLTRTQFSRNDGVNEEFYEKFFAERGYVVIAPEKLPLEQQISIIAHAKSLVCTMGTLSHMGVFAADDCELVFLLRYADTFMPAQLCINKLKNCPCSIIEATKNLLPTKQSNGTFYYFPTQFFYHYCEDAGIACTHNDVDLPSLYRYLQRWTANFADEKNYPYLAEFSSLDFLRSAYKFLFDKDLNTAALGRHLPSSDTATNRNLEKLLWSQIGLTNPSQVCFAFHFSNKGWMFQIENAAIVMQEGEQLEAIHLNGAFDICYAIYQRGHGWMEAQNGKPCGITGKGLPVQALWLRPVADLANFHVAYRVHIEGQGWSVICHDGEICGVAGDDAAPVRLSGIQIIVERHLS